MLHGLHQPPALGLGQGVHRQVRGNVHPRAHHRHHPPGQQTLQKIVEGLIGGLGDVPEYPGLQLLLLQGGLQVKHRGVGIPAPVGMGAGTEHQRPGEAEVGEKHLSLLLKDHFFLLIFQGQGHIFQGKSLHLRAGVPRLLQWNQRGRGGDDGMPGRLGQPVPVPRGAGGGVGQPRRWPGSPPRREGSPPPGTRQPPAPGPAAVPPPCPGAGPRPPFSGQKTRRRSRRPPGLNREKHAPLALSSGGRPRLQNIPSRPPAETGSPRCTESARFGSRAPARPRGSCCWSGCTGLCR